MTSMYSQQIAMTTFILFPMSIILLVSLVNVFIAIRGRFHPMDVMWRGLGGAVYILGFGIVTTNNMVIDTLSGSILMWGIAVKLIPRLQHIILSQLTYATRT